MKILKMKIFIEVDAYHAGRVLKTLVDVNEIEYIREHTENNTQSIIKMKGGYTLSLKETYKELKDKLNNVNVNKLPI
jgi:hypothetical protein